MLRAIIRHKIRDAVSGASWEELKTLTFDAPELERELCRGGFSETGYDIPELVGVSFIRDNP